MSGPGILVKGSELDKESVKAAKELVEAIFKSGFTNHMEQETVQVALEKAFSAVSVASITIQNCHVQGDKVVNQ